MRKIIREKSEKMKRKKENENSKDTKRKKSLQVGGNHLAWDIIIKKLDYQSQMKMSQQNRHLAEVVQKNAESDLRKFRRQIKENKYM